VAASSPAAAHLADALALVEQLAEEMSRRWQDGDRPLAEEYLNSHPELWDVPEAALELISEEIALHQEVGQEQTEAELVRRFPQWSRQVRTLLGCHQVMGGILTPPIFPGVGESLGEFDLLAELGRGSHARVFLARQPALAARLVVLKLGPRTGQEHLSLARLQHTCIVPLHSVHDFPEQNLRGLCQPYFGGATLAQLLDALRGLPPAQRTGRDLLDALRRIQSAAPEGVPVDSTICRFLARATYVQAVCWLGASLAEALQYAQERGLLHLDLKPSNVLLAADAQPMLLDFHLARSPLEAGATAPAWLGGTLAYMAPEHHAALKAVAENRSLPQAVDGRADVYSLGLLLCELLAGELPAGEEDPGKATRRLNPQVTRGLQDLLSCCLAADPARRYQSAASLAVDLRRHLADLPLRGVPNRSLAERWRKWRRRRPYALLLLAALVSLVGAGGLFLTHINRQIHQVQAALDEGQSLLDQHRYSKALDQFRHGVALTEGLPFTVDLRRQLDDRLHLAERARTAVELHRYCERIRPLYAVDVLPAEQGQAVLGQCRQFWTERESIVHRLDQQPDAGLQTQVRADLLDLAILWAHLHVRLAAEKEAAAARKQALAILAEAEKLFGPSCVLYQERRAHALALGLTEQAREAERQAESRTPTSAWEHYALGRVYFLAGETPRALEAMDRALDMQPQFLWPQFYRGCCAYRLGQHDDAVVAFSICVVLAPDSAWCFHNRALAFVESAQFDRALKDYDRALFLDPAFTAAALGRGMLHYREKRYELALADLERAHRNGLDSAALHCNMALVHLALQQRTAAVNDVRRALERDPQHRQANQLLLQLQSDH
jgi:serine/threonine protein kinase/lipoprotein NlpI